jgi:NitT/TauT family transport system substrate-binding protein
MSIRHVVAALALLLVPLATLHAEEIDVANYGVATNGMPFAVALAKGYFKQAGLNIDAVRSSPGGGTDVRMLLGGDLPYTESSLAGVVAAIQKGADLKIVSDNVHTVSEVLWVTMPGSPIKTLQDLKGKRISFTNPQSTTQALEFWLLETAGLKQDDVKMIAAGSFGASLTALESNGVDLAVMVEPTYSLTKGKYQPVIYARDVFPPICNVVGVTSGKVARERPEVVRGIIAARRKAVEFMTANRGEAAAIIAKTYKLDPGLTEQVMSALIDKGGVGNVPYWGPGDFNYEGLNNMAHAMTLIGLLTSQPDWSKMVDESFLPDDLKKGKS